MAKLVCNSKYRDNLLNDLKPIRLKWYEIILSYIFDTNHILMKENRNRDYSLTQNAFGLVLSEKDYPIYCGCGGSGFLCLFHANKYLKD